MSHKFRVIPVHGVTLAELCEKIEANVNDGGFSWDGRWDRGSNGYQAVMTKIDQSSPNRLDRSNEYIN